MKAEVLAEVGVLEHAFGVGGVLRALGVTSTRTQCGRYTLEAKLGEGGMGTVYRAHDPVLGRDVAIKVIRADQATRADTEIRAEARLLAQLSHPHVVTVFEVGVDHGQTWLAMELVEGQTLASWARTSPDAADVSSVLKLLHEAGAGLLAAHGRGIVHRDFKPANVLLGDDGGVKVADFGLARIPEERVLVSSGEDEATTEAWASIAGTPQYMAPEQHLGHQVDARTDQFAFAVSAWELLSGASPFPRSTVFSLVEAKLSGKVEGGHRIPRHLREPLLRALRPDPEDRFESMQELLAALGWTSRPRPWLWGGVLAGVVTLLVVGSPEPDGRCLSSVEPAWNETTRAGLEASFVRGGGTQGGEAWGRLVTEIDEHVARWSRAREDACARGAGPEVLDCFDASSRRFRHRLELAIEEPRAALDGVRWLDELDAADCTGSATVSADVLALERELDRAAELRWEGLRDEERERLEGVVARARVLGHRASLVHGLVALGNTLDHLDHASEALAVLDEAYVEAMTARDDQAIVELSNLARAVVRKSDQEPSVHARWLSIGRVAQERLGGPATPQAVMLGLWESEQITRFESDLVRARAVAWETLALADRLEPSVEAATSRAAVLNHLVWLQLNLGDYADAERLAREEIATVASVYGADHPDTLARHWSLADALRYQERGEEALAAAKIAVDGVERWYGAESSNAATAWASLSQNQQDVGDVRGALASVTRSVELAESIGESELAIAEKLSVLAIVQIRLEDFAGARATGERALAIMVEHLGPRHVTVAFAAHNVGEALYELGERELAVARFEQAADIMREGLGPDSPHLGFPLSGLLEAAVEQGATARAWALLRRASELAPLLGNDEIFAHLDWCRARLLWGEDPQRARALATHAMQLYREASNERSADEVAVWLAAHPTHAARG